MKDGNQTQSGADTESGAPQAEKQDTSGLLECENTVSSRKASASTAGDGKLQSGTFMCERGKMDRLREEDPVLRTHHTLFRLIR